MSGVTWALAEVSVSTAMAMKVVRCMARGPQRNRDITHATRAARVRVDADPVHQDIDAPTEHVLWCEASQNVKTRSHTLHPDLLIMSIPLLPIAMSMRLMPEDG